MFLVSEQNQTKYKLIFTYSRRKQLNSSWMVRPIHISVSISFIIPIFENELLPGDTVHLNDPKKTTEVPWSISGAVEP